MAPPSAMRESVREQRLGDIWSNGLNDADAAGAGAGETCLDAGIV